MSNNLTISIASCHQGQRKKGVEFGFTSFLNSLNNLININKYNIDYVDFRSDRYFDDPIYGSHILGNNILNKSSYESTLLTFGGDHTISYGTITASKKLFGINTKVIWIDAHPDINTPSSSLSGNCHGMPVSYLFGISKDSRLEDICIEPKDFAYIGIRCLDNFEKDLIDKLKKDGLQVYTAEDVKELGIKYILTEIRLRWSSNYIPKIHISLDIDSIDPKYAPATGTPVENGLEPDDVIEIISWANKNSLNNMANLDITEINPLLSDIGGVCKTYATVDRILKKYLSID